MKNTQTEKADAVNIGSLNNLQHADGIANYSFEYIATDHAKTQLNCALCSLDTAKNPNSSELCPEHAAAQDFLSAAIYDEISRPRKVVILHRCAGCLKHKASLKFSPMHSVCKDCVREMQGKSKTARSNFISRTMANFQRSLQGGLVNV